MNQNLSTTNGVSFNVSSNGQFTPCRGLALLLMSLVVSVKLIDAELG